jgi:hypothetical protein
VKHKGSHHREGGGKGGVQRHATLATRALDLRIGGMEYRKIAATLGVALSQAHRLVSEAMAAVAELNRGKAEELREIEAAKLDAIERDMRPRSERGDTNAAAVLVRVVAQRAKLYGLEAAQKHEISGPDGGPISIDGARAVVAERLAKLTGEALAGAAPTAPPESA